MDRASQQVVVSASDLVGHLACEHLTELDLLLLDGRVDRPSVVDEELEILQRRGLEHEAAYLESLRAAGRRVVEIAEPSGPDRFASLRQREAETVAAMEAGADVVFQATFLDETASVAWRGHADFLVRVDGPSRLGAHHYEPEDTKLARHLKPSAVLQLCHYAEQVERLQGVAPDEIHVVLGGRVRESVRLADVAAYYRAAQARFLTALGEERSTYPMPVSHCSVCRWNERCEERWAADDHLIQVARLGRGQARRLQAAGVSTMHDLAARDDDLTVTGVGPDTLTRLQHQARLQVRTASGEPMPVELMRPLEEARGLASLPEPDPGDIFYDIEGDPFVGDVGLEYLHGVGWVDGGELQFTPFWGHTPAEERQAFEALIDCIVERRERFPDLHVYHYAPYETTALGKLMGRYGTREAELDDLLRGNVFVDLYRVVRQGLVIGTPSYSLKKLEPLYMGARTGEIVDAGSSIVEYERWLDTGHPQILADIEAYNRDDVVSTWLLRDWLESQRAAAIAAGETIGRPVPRQAAEGAVDPAAAARKAEADAEDEARAALVDALLAGRTEPPGPDEDDDTRAPWLMAHLLSWHAREDKPDWWMFFDRILRRNHTDLLADTEAISGLEPVGEPEPDARSLIWTYRFDPDQEHKLKVGSSPVDPDAERARLLHGVAAPKPGELVALDSVAGTLQLRRAATSAALHPAALIPGGPIGSREQRASLARVAESLLALGVDDPGPHAAARQLLSRRPPRIAGVGPGEALRRPGEDALAAATRLVTGLDRSCLAIQGPPGAGKTYTAARAVVALLAEGRKVGITANSHAVISNLLEEVADAAIEAGVTLVALQKASKGDAQARRDAVEVVGSNPEIVAGLAEGANLVAGTSWLFARDDMAGLLHTLVVDEAGQLSLANVVAVAPAAENLVLVGDPQQLAQPSKGTHPPGVGLSALEHILGGAATIAETCGLFLDRSWRLHPEICAFISEQVYDSRLESHPHCVGQRIDDGPVAAGSGLRWLPVEHTGNRTSSAEEADAVAATVQALVGRPWTDRDGQVTPLSLDDVLVVAPYNSQVHLLGEALPEGARVGTVDKLQGQEAAVVIVSMTASSAEYVPRGMEFLYSRNRINVAVSRAQALCIVVASPALLAAPCRTVEQMCLVNVLCRYVELARPIALDSAARDPQGSYGEGPSAPREGEGHR